MITGRVSVLIPARNERFLQPTVVDVLSKARGDLEVIVILDGYWPDPPLPADPRLKVLHFGQARGMRPAINAAMGLVTGEYLLKCDAHTLWAEGFDVQLRADYLEDNWMLIPRRYALDPETWTIDTSNRKYPVDYHYLSEPFHKYGDSVPGLHGTAWTARRDARQDIDIDHELASQGSAYFLSRRCWDWLGGLKPALYGAFWYENLELSMQAWMCGGAQMVTKRTHYAHLYKGKRFGRGYSTRGMGHEDATRYATWFWMTDQPLKGRIRKMRDLIEMFAPVPTWPADLDHVFARAHRELRNPYINGHEMLAAEETAMKLKVRSARYGIGLKEGEFVDVTPAVTAALTKKGLRIPVTNVALQVGPVFPGKRKRLWVDATIDGVQQSVSAIERRTLKVP